MDTKALRQKILDLAIRGKLVPQDPSDEPASVLLERIRAEKQQMVKAGKLKPKDIKNDTVIYKGADNLHYEKFADGSVKCVEDEIPFELPEGWEWTRLGCIGNWQSGATPSRRHPEYYGGSIPWLKTGDLNDGFINSVSEYITEEGINNSSVVLNPVGSVLIAMYGATIGKLGIANIEVTTNQACCACLPILIINQYLFYFLMYQKKYFIEKAVGGAQPNISKKKIVATLFPVPPFREQKKIVSTVNNLVSKIDSIVKNKNEITNTIITIKSKILDLAIRGKLVPQDPNDEPASALLERIQSEKEELIKQGKIKRNKKESVIFKGDDNSYYEKIGNKVNCIDEEIPFELPESWAFIRLKTAWELISGRDLSPSDYNDKNDGIPYITGASNFKNGHVILVRWTPVPQVITRKGDLLLTCKGTIGKIAYNNFGEAHIARQIMAIRNNYGLNVDFLALCIEYSMTKIKQAAKGLIPGISREDILNLVIPVPPIKEQEKTCNKLKVIFSAIEHIENSLN